MIAAVKFLLAVATIGAYSFTSALLTGSVFTRYASSMQQRSSSVVLNQVNDLLFASPAQNITS